MPDHLQPLAIEQFERVLRPGGRIRLLEMVYSRDARRRRSRRISVTGTRFVKRDVYLVIDGERVER